MICLAFDTSTNWGRFALVHGDNVLVDRPYNVMGSYADTLLPLIDGMLEEAGLEKADVEAVAVTRGPGSFTGVRIGVATAKGLAYALKCPLYAVSTLDAMAAAMLFERREREWAVPLLDARRGELFAGIYRRSGGWVEAVDAPAAKPIDDWWQQIMETVSDPELPTYAGSGVALLLGEGESLRPELSSVGETILRGWSTSHPSTAKALAWAVANGEPLLEPVHPFTLVPSYLRASDAEVKRGLDLTPRKPDEGLDVMEARRPEPGTDS